MNLIRDDGKQWKNGAWRSPESIAKRKRAKKKEPTKPHSVNRMRAMIGTIEYFFCNYCLSLREQCEACKYYKHRLCNICAKPMEKEYFSHKECKKNNCDDTGDMIQQTWNSKRRRRGL